MPATFNVEFCKLLISTHHEHLHLPRFEFKKVATHLLVNVFQAQLKLYCLDILSFMSYC